MLIAILGVRCRCGCSQLVIMFHSHHFYFDIMTSKDEKVADSNGAFGNSLEKNRYSE